jgi:hypothetical protein
VQAAEGEPKVRLLQGEIAGFANAACSGELGAIFSLLSLKTIETSRIVVNEMLLLLLT